MQKTSGVMAAPNTIMLKARVINLQQDLNFSDKWHLEIKILDSESINGPNFARKGEEAEGFAFNETPGFSPVDIVPEKIIIAEAEYVGDAIHGAFRLSRIIDANAK